MALVGEQVQGYVALGTPSSMFARGGVRSENQPFHFHCLPRACFNEQ